MQQYGAAKNPPWARTAPSQSLPGMQQQLMGQNSLGGMGQPGMVQYQQSQPVFQPNLMQQQNMGLGIPQMQQNNVGIAQGLANQLNQGQMFQQAGVVTYPTPRALNPNAFSNTQSMNSGPQGPNNNSSKQRVFTGTVTKAHNDFGFVDEDVFFQVSACMKGSNPVVGDRVLVEASFNPNIPFKWNATRIQVLPSNKSTQGRRDMPKNKGNSGYNAVPPPIENQNGNYGNNNNQNNNNTPRSGRDRKAMGMRRDDNSRQRDNNSGPQVKEPDRKRKRMEREKERVPEKAVEDKDRTRSPVNHSNKQRRRQRPVARYLVQIPKIALDIPEADVLELKRRYNNLYIPSDFFNTQFRWIDAFPPNAPFTMNKPCAFHVIHKDINNPLKNDSVLEPPDVDYLFSAKVMLLSMPTLEEVYRRCCGIGSDEKDRDSEDRDFIHPTRLINFLVGLRGKNETMAIGGPWSPSLDGPNPEKDPSVLIKTAIRTCKAHTGIDLSNCTQWYRFVELYYRRAESVHRGRQLPARVETVVIFVPDVWSCLPTRLEWDSLSLQYKRQAEGLPTAQPLSDADQVEKTNTIDLDKREPTHYSELDPKSMSLPVLKKELEARNINNKGLKSQLIARLSKSLKQEASKDQTLETNGDADTEEQEPEAEVENMSMLTDEQNVDDIKKKEDDKEKTQEKENALWKSRHVLPSSPHLIVHPSRTAKSGKFDCTVMTLSLLLDYRPEDSKEHSFEVSLFAELFNEMLMRDFGFNIYKALCVLPDRPKEDEKKKEDPKKPLSDSKDKKITEDENRKSESEKDRKDGDAKKGDVKKDDKYKPRKDEKRDDSLSLMDEENSCDKKSTSGDKKDRREKNKLVTKDPHLLLSFVYFDTSHCGYIFEKDIEELLYTLGLNLSRAQVRKLVAKVVARESFQYRRLTDKSKDDNAEPTKDDDLSADLTMSEMEISELAAGNKKLLPVFKDNNQHSDVSEPPNKNAKPNDSDGFISYKGGLLDVEKLINQLKRSEQARLDTETKLVELTTENKKILEKQTKYAAATLSLTGELDETKKKLVESQNSLSRMTISSKIFHNALKEIDTKVMSVIHTNLYDDPDAVKLGKQESNSRWNSDTKLKSETSDVGAVKEPKFNEDIDSKQNLDDISYDEKSQH